MIDFLTIIGFGLSFFAGFVIAALFTVNTISALNNDIRYYRELLKDKLVENAVLKAKFERFNNVSSN